MAEKKGFILCVDDDPSIVRALQWLLQRDFEVLTTTSAQEAIELVQANDFDVVVSDQRMPVMTGVELLREVKRLRPRALRILLTGYSDMNAILRSVNESEVFRFVQKPWNTSDLPRILEQASAIARSQPLPAAAPALPDDVPLLAAAASILLIDDDAATHRLVAGVVGKTARLMHASNLADAIDLLDREPPAVILSEIRVGGVDITRLIRLMKQRHPSVVSVMLSGDGDADTVGTLINQGQIYRFVTKPVRAGYLELILQSALARHRELATSPALVARTQVEAPADGRFAENLVADAEQSALATANAPGGTSLLARVRAGFRRLFG